MTAVHFCLLAAMFLPGLAHGQQEIDPTWYDPWAKPAAAVVNPVKQSSAKPRKVISQPPDRVKIKKVSRAQPQPVTARVQVFRTK
jgi:hypothetical protein